MRGAGNQQSGTLSLRISTLEEPLEQQEVGLEADRSLDYTRCMLRKRKKKTNSAPFKRSFWLCDEVTCSSLYSVYSIKCVDFS